jgi:hypothetical protein
MYTWLQSLFAITVRLDGRRAARRMVYLIADRSVENVRDQLWLDTSRMSAAEFRGYVRARAHRIVRLEAARVADDCGLPASRFDPLVAPALERTVQLVVRQPVPVPVMPLPVPHVRLRIAG